MRTDKAVENKRIAFENMAEAVFEGHRKKIRIYPARITNIQFQKIQDLLDKAQTNFSKITNNQPLHTLSGIKYDLSNYWNGKIVAITEILHLLSS